jgi:polysaccharide export outer membrane protein
MRIVLASLFVGVLASSIATSAYASGQSAASSRPAPPQAAARSASAPAAAVPADYVIGAEDVLSIIFWRDKDLSAEVVVRPDGKISLPLLNDVQAAGLTPEQLRVSLEKAANRYIEDPNAAVVVKTINSRKFFITGQVTKPGTYPLTAPTTVLQAIALAGGLLEYADEKHISVMRVQDGRTQSLPFNYKDVIHHKNVAQNVYLQPGDTIVIP